MLSDEDIEDLGADLAPELVRRDPARSSTCGPRSSATPSSDSGGELLASIRIPKDVVDEVLAAS